MTEFLWEALHVLFTIPLTCKLVSNSKHPAKFDTFESEHMLRKKKKNEMQGESSHKAFCHMLGSVNPRQQQAWIKLQHFSQGKHAYQI